jgi:hypothetical protein
MLIRILLFPEPLRYYINKDPDIEKEASTIAESVRANSRNPRRT